MKPFNVYEKIQELRAECFKKCKIIDQVFFAASKSKNFNDCELIKLSAFLNNEKHAAWNQFQLDEAILLNKIPGLCPGPSSAEAGERFDHLMRLAAEEVTPLKMDLGEFEPVLSLIWLMCAISRSAAVSRSVPDYQQVLTQLFAELRRLKEGGTTDSENAASGSPTRKGLMQKPKPKQK